MDLSIFLGSNLFGYTVNVRYKEHSKIRPLLLLRPLFQYQNAIFNVNGPGHY